MMKSSKFLVLVFLFSQAHYFSVAQEKNATPVTDPSKLIEQVNLSSEKTLSITCDFRQEKEMSFMEETVISSGRFYFQKEKLLRWEYTEPFKYAIILNNNRIRIIDEGKNKDFDAGTNRMFLEISDIMSGMVNGTLLNSEKFKASWFETPVNYLVELMPIVSAMKDYLSMIVLEINKKDFSVDGLKMVEKSGDYTHITFQNKKFNEQIPADIFRVD
jgi:outer membrane lipoprotein-sorting protein